MKKLLAILVATLLVFSACAVAEGWTEHTLKDQFEYLVPEGEAANLDDYYNDLGIDCECEYRSTGGSVKWLGGADVPLPTPTKEYTIGFSVYYTVDEVGAMYLTGMQDAAKEIGVNLLVNDANYDQELQNQAIEGWILEDVDAVILTPCDFYGCQQALDALEEAGIPVVTLDCPPCAGSIDSAIVYDAVEQGRQAGEMLLDALTEKGVTSGKLYYGTLPFVHPNAVTREIGFKSVFEGSDFEIDYVTGEAPEEHYTALEGVLMAEGEDIVGIWGLYSSATWGFMQAIAASSYPDIPLTSVDNDRVILEGIHNGTVLGSSCYGAVEGSRLALANTINLLEGVDVPSIIYQTNTKVTADNVEEMFEVYYNGATLADYMAGN